MKITDPVEMIVAKALAKARVPFVHESEGTPAGLDFHLTDADVHVEVCRFHTPRKVEQTARVENVILIQGKRAAETFARLLEGRP